MGEEIACRFLKNKGYAIIDRNFYSRHGELDIVARKGSTLVIVEVKTRKNDFDLYACQAVTFKKIRNIKRAACDYLQNHFFKSLDYRFDVIECYWQTREIRHIVDAF